MLVLSLFFVFTVLDTLVIRKAITTVEDVAGIDVDLKKVTAADLDDGKIYYDGNITIRIYEERMFDTSVHIADVRISNPEYLKTAFAKNTYGKNILSPVKTQAEEHNAILAINGDYYGVRQSGYVVRNGVMYQNTSAGRDFLVIKEDGSFEVGKEGEVDCETLLENGAWQVFSFGPTLEIDGEILVGEGQEVAISSPSNPRTAIGIVDNLHYYFVVSDGRTDNDAGLSLQQLAEVMANLGAKIAYNLDGGGSSTMVFMGEVINFPTESGDYLERNVSDIVYIGY